VPDRLYGENSRRPGAPHRRRPVPVLLQVALPGPGVEGSTSGPQPWMVVARVTGRGGGDKRPWMVVAGCGGLVEARRGRGHPRCLGAPAGRGGTGEVGRVFFGIWFNSSSDLGSASV
jgi:hypothetical protein